MGCIQIIGSFSTKLAEKAIINYIQMGLFYMCAPHIYLLAPSLVMKKKEEKICEKSLVTSPLPLVTHCPDLSLSLVVFVEGTSL